MNVTDCPVTDAFLLDDDLPSVPENISASGNAEPNPVLDSEMPDIACSDKSDSTRTDLLARKISGRRACAVRRRTDRSRRSNYSVDWRLVDRVFDPLHDKLDFTLEGCADDEGLDTHRELPFCSKSNSVLERNLSGERVYVNPPWDSAELIANHFENCRKLDRANTLGVFVLPAWSKFDTMTSKWKLYQEFPARTPLFTRLSKENAVIHETVRPAPWPVRIWLIDSDCDFPDEPNVVHVKSDSEADDNISDDNDVADDPDVFGPQQWKLQRENAEQSEFIAALTNWDDPKPLLKANIILNDDIKIDALIDNAASLDFMSEDFARRHNLQIDKVNSKIPVKLANGQRVVCTQSVIVNMDIADHRYENRMFFVLRDLKVADVVLGLTWLDEAEVTIKYGTQRILTLNDGTYVETASIDRRPQCSIISAKRLQKLMRKTARAGNKTRTAEFYTVQLKLSAETDSDLHLDPEMNSEYSDAIKSLLYDDFPELLEPVNSPPKSRPWDHKINLTGPMKKQRLNRLSPAEKAELDRQMESAIAAGLVRPSQSEFGSPILFVRKADGSLRLCIDYRGLNAVTQKDAYPLPRIDETLDELRNARCYTHLDLASGYWQVKVHEPDIHKTAFQTPDGLYEWVAMSFGLTNAPATFQRMMNDILKPYLHKFVTVYLDDICIFSENYDDHINHLRLVLEKLSEHNLKLQLKKCFFGMQSMEYLGYTVSQGKLSVSANKISAVKDWPVPKTQSDVRSFVQFANFYSKFIHHFSDLTAPLTDLLRKAKPAIVTWSTECQEAFETLRLRLISAPCLLIPDIGTDVTFTVATDASNVGLAAVLLQDQGGGPQPVAYWARKLTEAERGNTYSAYDLEALAVCESIKHWRCYLEGCCRFLVVSDHDTLRHLLRQPAESLNRRQSRYVRDLQPYVGSISLAYRKGKWNEADPLSRRPDFKPISFGGLYWTGDVPDAAGTLLCTHHPYRAAELSTLTANTLSLDNDFLDSIKTGYVADSFYSTNGGWIESGHVVYHDGLYWRHGRLCLPNNRVIINKILYELHDTAGHRAYASTLAKALDRFWWSRLRHDVRAYCDACPTCRRIKTRAQAAAPVQPLPVPPRPWHTVGLDFVTNLPLSNGFDSLLVICCHLSRQAHFIPTTMTVTGEQSANLFLENIYRLHGLPRIIVSDRDTRFMSAFWQTLWRRLGTKLNMSSGQHAETDGLTERINAIATELARAFCCFDGSDWVSHIPMMEFSYNSSKALGIEHAPFEAVYGYVPETPPDLLFPMRPTIPLSVDAQMKIKQMRDVHTLVRSILAVHKKELTVRPRIRQLRDAPQFHVGDNVSVVTNLLFIKGQANKKLMDKQIGPFEIVEKIGQHSYRLKMPPSSKLHPVFHVNNLRPCPTAPLRPAVPVVTGTMEEDNQEFEIDRISDVKIGPVPGRVGDQLQFLTHFADHSIAPLWHRINDVHRTIALQEFMETDRWTEFSESQEYVVFMNKYPARIPKAN